MTGIRVLDFLQNIRSPFWDYFFLVITQLGGFGLVFVFIISRWSIDKDLSYKLAFSFCFAAAINGILKSIFQIPRPWIKSSNISPVGGKSARATGFSFPSGHATNATSFFAMLFTIIKRLWLRILCVVIIILVCFSRMYLGVHTPNDVIVGAVTSLVVVAIVSFVYPKMKMMQKTTALYFTVICSAIILILAVFVRTKPYNGGYQFVQVRDSFVSLGSLFGLIIGWFFDTYYIKFNEKRSLRTRVEISIVGAAVVLIFYFLFQLLEMALPSFTAFTCFVKHAGLVIVILDLYPLGVKMILDKKQK